MKGSLIGYLSKRAKAWKKVKKDIFFFFKKEEEEKAQFLKSIKIHSRYSTLGGYV